ncbi:SDR family NAD(P)-dependent oxidoreductase [Roseomonas sp. BN140053]|uniref:SDR family NAD(P)-dependent oxidoreductase n=1 Tax=Roseomonas sp. BN140053 TaxID=3391898 RepID=UPI0039EC44D5
MRIEELFTVAGRAALVTGGASGIGLAIAEALAANGARVALLDRDAAALARATARLSALGPAPHAEAADITDRAALEAAFNRSRDALGGLEIVFANAGISGGPGFLRPDGSRDPATAIEAQPAERWEQVMAVNLTAAFATIQAAVPHLKRGGGGRIIVTSSVSATKTELFVGTPYVVSKAGIAQLVRQAALELAAFNITVNAIAPGPVVTNIAGGRLQDPTAQEFFARFCPMGRMGSPADLQGAALFLASPAAAFVTGAEILVDGGVTLGAVRA